MRQLVDRVQVRNASLDYCGTASNKMEHLTLSAEGAVRVKMARRILEFDPRPLLLKQLRPTLLVIERSVGLFPRGIERIVQPLEVANATSSPFRIGRGAVYAFAVGRIRQRGAGPQKRS